LPHSFVLGARRVVSSASLQEIVCCMGQPVAGNPTQYMLEKAFAAAGLDWRYLTLEIPPEQLGDAVRGMRAMGFRGGNFTIPHKVAVVPLLDRLSDTAAIMGAVNCVVRRDGQLVGENTDGQGFLQSLRTLIEPQGKKIVLLGAGGAARAIAVELGLARPAVLTIVNRNADRGRELVEMLRAKNVAPALFAEWYGDYVLPPETDIVINATSIGLGDRYARVPLDYGSVRAETVAADVVFSPPKTVFLAECAARGARTLDGLGMLVNQAVISFRLWTGQDPDAEVMREALEEFLGL
jgi:shikimate dehydrogenase